MTAQNITRFLYINFVETSGEEWFFLLNCLATGAMLVHTVVATFSQTMCVTGSDSDRYNFGRALVYQKGL